MTNKEFNSVIVTDKVFWARVQVTFTIYLKDSFGIYSVNDTYRGNRYTIKGDTVTPLSEQRCYKAKLVEKYDEKRHDYTTDILEIYEVEPEDHWEEFSYLHCQSSVLSGKSSETLLEELCERVKIDEQVEALVGFNMSFKDAKRFAETHKETALTTVKNNPYILLDLTTYITFSDCDRIADFLSYNITSSIRITSAIREAIKEYCTDTGDMYAPIEVVKEKAKKKLNYYLTLDEMNNILNAHSEPFFDYTVFNFENMIDRDELEKCLKNKTAYLFCDIPMELIEHEIEDINNINKFETSFEDGIDVIELGEYLQDEIDIVTALKRFTANKKNFFNINDLMFNIKEYQKNKNINFSTKQIDAIKKVLECREGGFYIINGSAGTGKTTVVEAILNIYSEMTKNDTDFYILQSAMAPTGRAADILSKSIKSNASTIHKKLGYQPESNTFLCNKFSMLPENFIIVDETSMLDTWLCARLLEAINPNAKVIFLGDDKQLPSVGPGKVLHDILEGYSDVVTLTEVKRQNNNSGILENALAILKKSNLTSFKDSVSVKENDINKQLGRIVSASRGALKHFSQGDIEVLLPMKIGILGTRNVNRILQPIFNPDYTKSRIKIKEGQSYIVNGNYYENYLCVGDKVINNRNIYNINRYSNNEVTTIVNPFNSKVVEEKKDIEQTCVGSGITNGEIGIIDDIRETDVLVRDSNDIIVGINHTTRIVVKYPSRYHGYEYVFYDDESDALSLAYAITIHKSQGSSWPCTINVFHKSHSRMISNELLYVAATRASKLNCFITDDSYDEKVSYYMNNRKSCLSEDIKKEFK